MKIKSEINHWVKEKDEAGRKTCRESAFSVTVNDRKKLQIIREKSQQLTTKKCFSNHKTF